MNYRTLLETKSPKFLNESEEGFYAFLTPDRVKYEGKSFYIINDGFPVSEGHLLVISKRIVQDYFSLSNEEKCELNDMIIIAKNIIEEQYVPSGYNIGMNCGKAAGQTIMHFHCHLIPRYWGDMDDPRGGVRNCIPDKGNYLI